MLHSYYFYIYTCYLIISSLFPYTTLFRSKVVGELIAVCDTIKEKANAFAEKYNAKAYYSIDELLASEKEIDVITICTPNGLQDRKSTRLNSSHLVNSYAVFCLKKKNKTTY